MSPDTSSDTSRNPSKMRAALPAPRSVPLPSSIKILIPWSRRVSPCDTDARTVLSKAATGGVAMAEFVI